MNLGTDRLCGEQRGQIEQLWGHLGSASCLGGSFSEFLTFSALWLFSSEEPRVSILLSRCGDLHLGGKGLVGSKGLLWLSLSSLSIPQLRNKQRAGPAFSLVHRRRESEANSKH